MRVIVTPAVCPRLFQSLITLTYGALRKNQCVISPCDHRKKNNNKDSLSSCDQQCTMSCQERNRIWKRILRCGQGYICDGSLENDGFCNRRMGRRKCQTACSTPKQESTIPLKMFTDETWFGFIFRIYQSCHDFQFFFQREMAFGPIMKVMEINLQQSSNL